MNFENVIGCFCWYLANVPEGIYLNFASQIIVLSYVFSISFSSHAASADVIILLAGNVSENEVQLDESTGREELTLRIGDPLKVIVENASDFNVFLPAAPSACAVITIERRKEGSWRNWSDCEGWGRVTHPTPLAPSQSIDGTRGFRQTIRVSTPAIGKSPPVSHPGTSAEEALKQSAGHVPKEKEVQQLIIEPRSVPFFEEFRTLPAGDYRLATSYAFSDRPKDIKFVRSMPFSVVDCEYGKN